MKQKKTAKKYQYTEVKTRLQGTLAKVFAEHVRKNDLKISGYIRKLIRHDIQKEYPELK